MEESDSHSASVEAWLRGRAGGLRHDELIRLLQGGLDALWGRARVTLGEVTLGAIGERVFHDAAESFPALPTLAVEATGFRVRELRGHVDNARPDEIIAWIRFVLSEFLRVLGSLTGEILTPALHAELEQIARPATSGEEGKP